ncbi:hypothetical protein [Nocardiopsis trehalosi]|uniref:hypothetical protein n=1 Tax=Nocardiopsis trehalosi TaxID=109329 RepID=UPI0008306CFE|nr:hypothetical protein [Nocardiopsis trehalosi]
MTTIRLRGRIDIRTTRTTLTRADAQHAWATTGDIPAGCPIDIHVHGVLHDIEPGALDPLGTWLADAPEVVLHTGGGEPNALHRAVQHAIDTENRVRTAGGAA